jgi:hypothetical protein
MHLRSAEASKLRSLIAASIAVLALAAADAAPLPPAWTRDFAAPIQWQRVTAFGQLLVSTTGGLHAVDPNTGAVVWSLRDLVDLPVSGVAEIAGSPLVLISDTGASPRTVVLERSRASLTRAPRISGRSRRRALPQAGGLLVAGPEPGAAAAAVALFHRRRCQLWKSWSVLGTTLNPGGNALMGLLLSAALVGRRRPCPESATELGDGTFLLGNGSRDALRASEWQGAGKRRSPRHLRVPAGRCAPRCRLTSAPRKCSRRPGPIKRLGNRQRRSIKVSA